MAEVAHASSSSSSDAGFVKEKCPEKCSEKWSGGVHLVLQCKLEAAWSLQSDFLGLTKWAPTISECRLEEGEFNAIGCLRYCKGSGTTWVHERLLEFDRERHYMSYRMEDNHFVFRDGFQGYVAKVQLGDAGEGKTWVTWTYEVDPVATLTREELTEFMIKFYTQNLEYLATGARRVALETNQASLKSFSTDANSPIRAVRRTLCPSL